MATTYTETPDNYNEIESFITSDVKNIKKAFFLLTGFCFMMHVHFKDILIYRIGKRIS